jgi:hypothetical protein
MRELSKSLNGSKKRTGVVNIPIALIDPGEGGVRKNLTW